MLQMQEESPRVIITEDLTYCPNCENNGAITPLVKTGTHDRSCNTCGFVCKLQTPSDELDIEAEMALKRRGDKRGVTIARYQTRW